MESTASFDMGDLSLFMPVLHCITSGIEGGLHSKDYRIIDVEDAFITPVKMLACTLIDLLADGAAGAAEVQKNYTPQMTRKEYIDTLFSLEKTYHYKD